MAIPNPEADKKEPSQFVPRPSPSRANRIESTENGISDVRRDESAAAVASAFLHDSELVLTVAVAVHDGVAEGDVSLGVLVRVWRTQRALMALRVRVLVRENVVVWV